jgi:hypothetical protein
MATVELTEAEWTQAIGFMSFAPARECMPLINKIAAQVAQGHLAANQPNPLVKQPGNGQEVERE